MPSKTSVCLRCWNICACHQGAAYHQSWQPPNGCILAPFAALGMTEEGTKKLSMRLLSCGRIYLYHAVAEIFASESGRTAVVMAPLRVMISTCTYVAWMQGL